MIGTKKLHVRLLAIAGKLTLVLLKVLHGSTVLIDYTFFETQAGPA